MLANRLTSVSRHKRPASVWHVQPALPAYRFAYFSSLYQRHGLSGGVLYPEKDTTGLPVEVIESWQKPKGRTRKLPFGLLWQQDALFIPLSRGDILVLSSNPRYLTTLLLSLKARLRGARVIWWGHYWSSTSRGWRMRLRVLLMTVANAVLFYTEREIDEYKERLGRHDKRPIGALNNGINTAPIQAERRTYLAQLRQRELLFVGRLTPKAGLSLLVQALALPQMEGIHLHVVGEGENSAAVHAAAEAAGISKRITWHGMSTDEQVIGAIANRCRLFVYPGQVGLSLIHAMAYGLPCIVHSDRWRHMPEIAAFEAERTGRSFAPDDAEDLANVIAKAIDDPDLLNCFSARCIKITNASFNTSNMADRFMSLVKRLK